MQILRTILQTKQHIRVFNEQDDLIRLVSIFIYIYWKKKREFIIKKLVKESLIIYKKIKLECWVWICLKLYFWNLISVSKRGSLSICVEFTDEELTDDKFLF